MACEDENMSSAIYSWNCPQCNTTINSIEQRSYRIPQVVTKPQEYDKVKKPC